MRSTTTGPRIFALLGSALAALSVIAQNTPIDTPQHVVGDEA